MKRLYQLTIDEKAQQLSQTCAVFINRETKANNTGCVEDVEVERDKLLGIGSVLNFDGVDSMRSISDAVIKYSSHKIPPIFMHDVVHGYKIIYPIPLALAGSFDMQLIHDCCKMAAEEATLNGVQVTFAPMVDLVRDSRWGRVMESAGEDPYLNGEVGKAQIKGFHDGGLMCCVKHFAGYGAVESGKEYNTTDISDYALKEFYLKPYKACLDEKPEMIMTSFNVLNGKPVNANKKLLLDVLRKEWGFDGVVISDYNAIAEMKTCGYLDRDIDCADIALNNGIDIEMTSTTYMQSLKQLIESGRVNERLVDNSVQRVLELKRKAGIFDNRYGKSNKEKAHNFYNDKNNRMLARKAAEKTIVLLKNEEHILPLNPLADVFVAGDFALEKDIIGNWRCFGNIDDSVSVFEGLEKFLGRKITYMDSKDNKCPKEEYAIVCIGEKSNDSGESRSKAYLELDVEQVSLVKKLYKENKKVIAIVFAGRPLVLSQIQDFCNAILYAWQPGMEGGNAIANILFGKAYPSAKLTMSFPRTTGQCPIYYNYLKSIRPDLNRDYKGINDYCSTYIDECSSPLYPFGYGLTYTEFSLKNFILSSETIGENQSVYLSVVLTNEGNYFGETIIQLYIQDITSSFVRPIRELKGYKKVALNKGCSTEVKFEIKEEMLRFNTDNGFVSEAGEFKIEISIDGKKFLYKRLVRL